MILIGNSDIVKKKKTKNTTLETTDIIGIKSENNDRVSMSVLVCFIVTAAVLCLAKMGVNSFLLFGRESVEPVETYFSSTEKFRFYAGVVCGSLLICGVNALYKHSVKAICTVLSVYVFVFASHYQYVANGFIRVVNKGYYSILSVSGAVSSMYFLTYFDSTDVKAEIIWFLLAVIFGFCFLLAYIGVRRCSALWFTLLVMSCTAIPFSLNCLEGEGWFITLSVLCIIMYSINVQGYKRASKRNTVTHFGHTLKIGGKYSAYAAFQQTVLMIVAALFFTAVIYKVHDFSGYERGEKAKELSSNIVYSVETIVSGTALNNIGKGQNNTLNNGQLSNLEKLDFTGSTMFEIKGSRPLKLYLRSYSAALYTEKRWEPLSSGVYKSCGFWNEFTKSGFFPQFVYPQATMLYSQPSNDGVEIKIRNKDINHKIFLTDYRMLPNSSGEAVEKSSYKYDGCFTFRGFGGQESYTQNVMNIPGTVCPDYFGEIPSIDHINGMYEMLRDGEYYNTNAAFSDFAPDPEEESLFEQHEAEYRRFAVDNYLSYPGGMEQYLPEGFDDEIQRIYSECISSVDESDSMFLTKQYYEMVSEYIRAYLRENAEYTLNPGKTPSDRDFVEYFINESHKGFCVHFATAAVLMLRRAGIPARYCEGYFVSQSDLDKRFAGADGYRSIRDSSAHAWAEAYYPMTGWQAVECTPFYSEGTVPEENKNPPENSDTETQTDTETEQDTDSDSSSDTETETDTDTQTDTQTDTSTDKDSEGSAAAAVVSSPKKPSAFMKALAVGARILLILLLIAALYIGLRLLVRRLRLYLFSRSDTRKAALSMYVYALWLLSFVNIKKNKGEGDEAFAKRSSGVVPTGEPKKFRGFVDTALSARFGRNAPEVEETAKMLDFVKQLSSAIYNAAPEWKKLIIKFIFFAD